MTLFSGELNYISVHISLQKIYILISIRTNNLNKENDVKIVLRTREYGFEFKWLI